MSDKTHVAIVGGGMAGATLALMLKQVTPELRVTLIEAKPMTVAAELPSFDQRTTAIAPTTQNVFERLGLWSALEPFSSPIAHIQVSDKGQLGMATLGPSDNNGNPLGYVVKNSGLGEVLLPAISSNSGVCVLAPQKVAKVKPRANGVTLELVDNSLLETSLLIIADGAESPLRKQLGIGERTHDYEQHAVVTSVRFERPHQQTAFERFTQAGPLALLPLQDAAGKASGLVWTWPNDRLAELKSLSDQQFLAQLQQQFGYRLGRFLEVGQRSYYPLSLRIATEQVRSNIVLMGNAAHFLHPVAGQGFNLAIRDILRLVSVLKHAPLERIGHLTTLQQYIDLQQSDQNTTTFLSHNFNQWFRQTSWGMPQLRGVGFGLFECIPGLRQQLILQMSGRAKAQALPWS